MTEECGDMWGLLLTPFFTTELKFRNFINEEWDIWQMIAEEGPQFNGHGDQSRARRSVKKQHI